MIEVDLLRRCIAKESKACRDLYFQLFNLLMGVSMRYQKNETDAKAIVNRAFLKILDHLKDIDLDRPIEGWVKKICIHENIDKYRREKKYRETIHFPDVESKHDDINTTYVTAEELLSYEDLLNMVRELPDVTGQVFNLYAIDGYKHQEIAGIIGFSEGTSKWYLSQARKMLKSKIEREVERHKAIIYEKK